jgi:hypothetical protein
MSTDQIIHVPEFETTIIPAKVVASRQTAIWTLMAESMEKQVDYGKTPGCGDKPSLFKAGSEKILAMFQLAVDPLVEDLCPLGAGAYDEFRVRVHVTVKEIKSGRFVGKGVGECSSWEEKYKWRRAVNDAEFDYLKAENPELVRTKFSKGYNGKADYQTKQVRVPTADIANTIVKMGKKRAQIDATLTATAASAIFSQDLEDMPEELAAQITEEREQAEIGEAIKRPQRKEAKAEEKPAPRDPECISEGQGKRLYAICKQLKLSDDEIKAEMKKQCKDKAGNPLEHTRDMLKKDYEGFIDSVDPKFLHHDKPKAAAGSDSGKYDPSNF